MIDMAKYKSLDKIIIVFTSILVIYGVCIVFSNNEGFKGSSITTKPSYFSSIYYSFSWGIVLISVLLRIVITVGIIGIIIYAVTSHSQSSIP